MAGHETLILYIPCWAAFLIAASEQFTGFFLLITELLLHRVVVEVQTPVLHHGDAAPAGHGAGGERDLGPGVGEALGAAGAISSTLATFIKPGSCSQLQITTYFLQFIFLVTSLISLPLPLATTTTPLLQLLPLPLVLLPLQPILLLLLLQLQLHLQPLLILVIILLFC